MSDSTPVYRGRVSIDLMIDADYAGNVGNEKWQRVSQELATIAEGLFKANGIPVVVDGDAHATVHFHDGESGCSNCHSNASDGWPLKRAEP